MDSVQSMASSSSSTGPSSEWTSHFSSQTKIEMEFSKAYHWSQLDYSTTDSKLSAETNFKYFDLLKEDPQWGRFFTDFPALEVGEKISGGAQADIYEARNTCAGPFDLVVKVMKGDAPLKAFQAQWPIGMLSARSKYKHLFDLPLITILGGTVLHDKRLRGRFAFVMYRRWGDLRLLIDHQMKQERNTPGPFPINEAIHFMLSIAEDMDKLHNKHDILHRDLKASNVLVWGESGEGMSLVATSNHLARIGSVVADFECSVGVLGTGFWRAPEILEQLKGRVPSSEVQFTRASDVYSYGMICYEIVTGCLPHDGLGGADTTSQILNGRCPELLHDLPEFVRSMIVGCWHSDPSKRPTFSEICMVLKLRESPNAMSVVNDNKSKRDVNIVKDGFVGMDFVQSMASSSSSTGPFFEWTSHFSSQTEIEMEFSKAYHWSQLDYSTTDSKLSAETNFKYFDLLKEDPQWGCFFIDFPALEVGEKISRGAQADIYEARNTCAGPFDLVVKVMKGDAPLKAFQAQWPIGMLSTRSKYKHLFGLPLNIILGGTVLHDKRLQGRFAFVMRRRWGDLRLLIDHRMKQERNTLGPFPIDEAIHLMLSIAKDMDTLHNKHDILHRDLKASNVLVWEESGEDMSLVATSNHLARIGSVVADFESFVGVLGTGFWRAPEILEQLKDRVPNSEVQFTRASDVYSYGMTCYEIVTGCLPYDGLGGEDTISKILQGQCPEFPHELPDFVRNIIIGCWHSNPSERLTFSEICMALKLKRGPNPKSVVIDNKSKRGASIVKVEQWNNPQPLTLLEVMLKLMDMDLSILKASDSSSTKMITQYFEVADRKGRKVVDDRFIANITKVLSLPIKMKWICESLGTSIYGNTIVQMHVVEFIAKTSAFLQGFSSFLDERNYRVHSLGCCTREDRVECVIYVEGVRLDTLLGELGLHMKSFSGSIGLFKVIVHKVAAQDFSQNRRLDDLKFMDYLTLPRNSSNVCVHQRKYPVQPGHCPDVVVYFEKPEPLVHVSSTLADMKYKIWRASIDYPGPYEFLKSRANKREDIIVGARGYEELGFMKKILDVAIERGCPEVNLELIVSGPIEVLHDDMMRSLHDNGLFVTGVQFYGNIIFWRLDIFVTDIPLVRAS